ncbi:MAG: hypothetical protein ACODAE_11420 [Gemmatimonadota bacterium]
MRGVVSLVVAVLAAAVAPADAHAQRGGDGARSGAVATACPGDIPGIRRGLTNIMQVNSTHWLRQRRRLGLTDAEGAEVRVLGDRAVDATVCRRLIARLSRAHRARRDGRPRYDIVFFQVGDRYVIALREARAERRLGVPQMPDRAITFDLSLNRLVEHTWP